jgi:hypothetical protein
MSDNLTPATTRWTLRDLPLPAKLVLTTFLISVGLGYLWAMAQIHFKHATDSGKALPGPEELVPKFSGVPWPLEPRPERPTDEKPVDDLGRANAVGIQGDAVKVKTLLAQRCVWCHKKEKEDTPLGAYDALAELLKKTTDYPKGHLYRVLTGERKSWDSENMVKAFFEKSEGWKDLPVEERKKLEPQREAERLALLAWVEAGAPKAQYEADAFPLPADSPALKDLSRSFRTVGAAVIPNAGGEKKPVDKWTEAKNKRLSVDKLTQSTHAHLLTFSLLWAATGLIFAFTSYPSSVRCLLSPLVLIAQVIDVACWWLARLEPPVGPYFALAIMATGAIVGMGLTAQIVLSIWNMYGPKGKAVVVLMFLTGAGLFGLTYVKVIAPQLEAEKTFVGKAGE